MKENEMVFGIRAVIEAIQADKEIDKILIKRELQGELSRELFEVLRGREIPVQRVPAERLDRLTRKNHQGVIAFIPAVTYQRLEDIMKILSRWYDMNVVYENEGLKNIRFGCNLNRYEEITPFVKLLEKTEEVHVKIEGNTITFHN